MTATVARHWLAAVAVTSLLMATIAGGMTGSVVALAVIVVLGVPHGALDTERVRPILRPRVARVWFGVYAIPYLGLAALVIVGFREAPAASLALFLALSVFHFGTTDAGFDRPMEAAARGGLPIAMAVLSHPDATARVLTDAAGATVGVPDWLWAASIAWVPLGVFVMVRALLSGRRAIAAEMATLAAAFAVLPPLVALAGYFVLLHAPRHMTHCWPNTCRACGRCGKRGHARCRPRR